MRPVARRTSRAQQQQREALEKELAKLRQELKNGHQVLAMRAKLEELAEEEAQAEASAVACAAAVARFENVASTVQPFTSHSHSQWEVTQAEKKHHAAKLVSLDEEKARLEKSSTEAADGRVLRQSNISDLESRAARKQHRQRRLEQQLAVLDRQAACDQATKRLCSAPWPQWALRWLVRMCGPDSNYTVASRLSYLGSYLWPRLLSQPDPAPPLPVAAVAPPDVAAAISATTGPSSAW